MYVLFNVKQNDYVRELKPNFINKCGVASCGYHLEVVEFKTKELALSNAKRRKSYKDLIIIEK